jgi:starch phosphorylase
MNTIPEGFTCPTVEVEDDRSGLSIETLRRALADHLFYLQGKWTEVANLNDFYLALAYVVRDRLLKRWLNTKRLYRHPDTRIVCYLSAEFLLGPHLGNNLINLDIEGPVREAISQSGLDLDDLMAQEEEPGLGNGGLGRLAACYMDSLASLEVLAIGYGIRYEFGIFDQEIKDGWQVEITDKWLQNGYPWEMPRPEYSVDVCFGGRTESYTDTEGRYRVRWVPHQVIKGIPMTPRLRAIRSTPSTPCGCGKRRRWSPSTSKPLTPATTTGPWTKRWCRRTLPKFSIPTTSPSRASNCD